MANLRSVYTTQIALVNERAGDRDILLDDLDPNRSNSRVVALQAVERMRANLPARSLEVSLESGYVTEDLAGTKNSSNVSFQVSSTPDLGALDIIHNGVTLTRVASSASTNEYTISGTSITVGLAPDSSDALWSRYRKS